MKNKFTHQGYIVGCDARTPSSFSRLVRLRETKNFWITEHGNKYHKRGFAGSGVGDWPLYKLQTETMSKLTETK